MHAHRVWALAYVLAPVIASACGSDSEGRPKPTTDAGVDAPLDGADATVDEGGGGPAGFERFCLGKPWRETFDPATVGIASGEYKGALPIDFAAGIQETVKVVPAHPFAARQIRVAFASGSGAARIRFMHTFGRTYPASFADPTWPDHPAEVDLVEPIEIVVTDAQPDDWIELEIPETLLLPTQHYMIVYEHLAADPRLAIDAVAPGDVQRSLIFRSIEAGEHAFGVRRQLPHAAGRRSFLRVDGRTT